MYPLRTFLLFILGNWTVVTADTIRDKFNYDRNLNSIDFSSYNITKNTRFLIFDVYIGEGFNLKRNVHARAAHLVRYMIDRGEDWILVLPEWRRLYHWKTRTLWQEQIPWGQFFDLKNLNLYVPTMEFLTFWKNIGSKTGIEHVIVLQRNKEREEEKFAIFEECNGKHYYKFGNNGLVKGLFFGRQNEVFARKLSCLSVKEETTLVMPDILKELPERFIMVDYFEYLKLAYRYYAEPELRIGMEQARRSQVYAKHLREEADRFRLKYLDSNDEKDKTVYHDEDWRLQVAEMGSARGGPYIGVHMRRDDWKKAHPDFYFTIEELAQELKKKLREFGLKKVYVATDGSNEEVEELQSYLGKAKLYRYPNNWETAKRFSDGGIAIIEQWIVAHSRYFISSLKSTFSDRIHEERFILGFSQSSTQPLCTKTYPKDKCGNKFPYHHRYSEKQQLRLDEAERIKSEMNKHRSHGSEL